MHVLICCLAGGAATRASSNVDTMDLSVCKALVQKINGKITSRFVLGSVKSSRNARIHTRAEKQQKQQQQQ